MERVIEIGDWRVNASIVGLIKFFKYHNIKYDDTSEDCIKFHDNDITEERYLLFAENYFKDLFHHTVVEDVLEKNEELTDEQKKLISEKLKGNTVMKKVFTSTVNVKDYNLVLNLIKKNRIELIKDTFKNGIKMYRKFNNPNRFFSYENDCCRVVGYDFDAGKKKKSVSYMWNSNTYNYQDDVIFDFIPFAFSKSDESFFVNNNFSIRQLIETNKKFETSGNLRSMILENLKSSSEFLDYDVEVIIKSIEVEYYETLFLRKQNIELLSKIRDFDSLKRKYKLNENIYIDIEKEVFERILNNKHLDEIILWYLKLGNSFVARELIEINMIMYRGDLMTNEMKQAYAIAKTIKEKLPANKLMSYKQKLISSVTFKDYDKFCNIILQLAVYSETEIPFSYSLFENFEDNKNLAYTFINAL